MLTCEEKIQLGLRTGEQCQSQYLTGGIIFTVGLLLFVAFIIWDRNKS